MKKKALIFFLATMTATALLFTGCKNKETETTTVAEEAIEESDTTESEEIEPVEEENLDESNEVEGGSAGASIIVDGEIVEGTALTQAEIDELKANAPTDDAKENVEIYEAIINNGKYDFGGGADPITRVVGTPGDTSWRRMTDEEAQRIFETADQNSSEYSSAKAELQGAEWSKIWGNTVYFDYYEYKKVIQAHLEEVRNSEEYRIVHEEVQRPEEGSPEWRAALGWD